MTTPPSVKGPPVGGLTTAVQTWRLCLVPRCTALSTAPQSHSLTLLELRPSCDPAQLRDPILHCSRSVTRGDDRTIEDAIVTPRANLSFQRRGRPDTPSTRHLHKPLSVHVSPDRSEQPQRTYRSRRSTSSMCACGPKLSTPAKAQPLGRCTASLVPTYRLSILCPLVSVCSHVSRRGGREVSVDSAT